MHGWADQRWTLERIKTLIGRLFRVSYTVEGTWQLLKRHGWSWQQPTGRAIERDADAVEVWKKEAWPRVGAPRQSAAPGSSSRTKPGSRRLRRVPGPGVGSARRRSCGCGAEAWGGCRWRAWPASSRAGDPGSSLRSASIGSAGTSRRASDGWTPATWSCAARIRLGGPIVPVWGKCPPLGRRHEGIHRRERRVAVRVPTPGLHS
ncbi:winged helix-turn-helix domain-containing protein [Streptomyces sp. NPDC059679]|uniref:helix-turn-helix domain-containing protein n=1 Tax=Streptomyces sp. NPDC059679 TaxID=3346903 RepID=UPI0036798463